VENRHPIRAHAERQLASKRQERIAVIAEIEGGRITGFREYYDAMTLIGRLVLVPAQAP